MLPCLLHDSVGCKDCCVHAIVAAMTELGSEPCARRSRLGRDLFVYWHHADYTMCLVVLR